LNTKELLLSVLMSGPATGYDIKKVLENEVSEVVDVTISNIYPALNELASEGLVSCERVEQENRPNKKVYAITDAGREVCLHALMTSPARHRLRSEFMFILSFAPYLPKSRVAELIEQRLAEIDETEETLQAMAKGEGAGSKPLLPGQKFCVGLGRALIEAERSYIRQNSHWLLASERDAEPRLELAAH